MMIKNELLVISMLLVCTFVLLPMGCSEKTPIPVSTIEPDYKTYEMKSNDVRLRTLDHPLFKFEYPKEFTLADLNKAYDLVIPLEGPKVEFFCDLYEEPLRYLSILVNKGRAGYYVNAEEKLKFLTSETILYTENYSTKKVLISGIVGDYLESYQKPLSHGKQDVYRTVVFDYAGFIWEIDMFSFSYYPEPSEVQEAFDHIISTFKIIE